MSDNDKPKYKEFRADGWPLCPCCGGDELYSMAMMKYAGQGLRGEKPTLQKCLDGEMHCYECDWTSEKPPVINYFLNININEKDRSIAEDFMTMQAIAEGGRVPAQPKDE